MKILDTKFVKGFVKMADDGFSQGWHERNGGNLSYRLKKEEVQEISSRLNDHSVWLLSNWMKKEKTIESVGDL